MKENVFAFISALMLTGCTSSYILSPLGVEGSISYQEFNNKTSGETNRIELLNGQQAEGRNVQVIGDSVVWLDESTGKTSSVTIDKIKTVVRRNHSFGALEGFGFGLFIGGASGALSSIGKHSSFLGDSDLWAYYALAYGVVGGVLGGTIGGIIGDTYNYRFVDKANNKKK